MASTIVTVSGDKRIELANSQCARLFDIGTTWNEIRIGMRMCMTDPGGNLTGTPRLAVGVCSGTTNIMGDSSADNWVGAISNLATWIRVAGPPTYAGTSLAVAKKVGSTLTVGTGFAGTLQCSYQTGIRLCYFVDIAKGSPNYTLKFFGFQVGGGTQVDITQAAYFRAVESPAPSVPLHSLSAGVTIATDESAGSFNAANIHWDQTSAALQMEDVAVVRLS